MIAIDLGVFDPPPVDLFRSYKIKLFSSSKNEKRIDGGGNVNLLDRMVVLTSAAAYLCKTFDGRKKSCSEKLLQCFGVASSLKDEARVKSAGSWPTRERVLMTSL